MRILMVNLVNWARVSGSVQHQLGLIEAWAGNGHTVMMISPRSADLSALPGALRPRVLFSPDVQRCGLWPSLNTLSAPLGRRREQREQAQAISRSPGHRATKIRALTPEAT